jgi:hypothetical protein
MFNDQSNDVLQGPRSWIFSPLLLPHSLKRVSEWEASIYMTLSQFLEARVRLIEPLACIRSNHATREWGRPPQQHSKQIKSKQQQLLHVLCFDDFYGNPLLLAQQEVFSRMIIL